MPRRGRAASRAHERAKLRTAIQACADALVGVRELLGALEHASASETSRERWNELVGRVGDAFHVYCFPREEGDVYATLAHDVLLADLARERLAEHGEARRRFTRVRERLLVGDVEGVRREAGAYAALVRRHLTAEARLFAAALGED